MEAKVTITTTSREFDVLREALGVAARAAGVETVDESTAPADRKSARTREAEIRLLLEKLGC